MFRKQEDQGFLRLNLASLRCDLEDANCSHEAFILAIFSLLVLYYSFHNLTAWNSESQSIHVRLENAYSEVNRFLVLHNDHQNSVKCICSSQWRCLAGHNGSLEAVYLSFSHLSVTYCSLLYLRRHLKTKELFSVSLKSFQFKNYKPHCLWRTGCPKIQPDCHYTEWKPCQWHEQTEDLSSQVPSPLQIPGIRKTSMCLTGYLKKNLKQISDNPSSSSVSFH